jgi:phage N-6-adenine-methyltransferase
VSEQNVGTPRWLLDLVERTWGKITLDVAASEQYHACELWLGKEDDSLSLSHWNTPNSEGIVWCNPPYEDIGPWCKKASEAPCVVVMLILASVGSKWWHEHVHGKAAVYFVRPRVKFIGHKQGMMKDVAIVAYGAESPGYYCIKVTEKDVVSIETGGVYQ